MVLVLNEKVDSCQILYTCISATNVHVASISIAEHDTGASFIYSFITQSLIGSLTLWPLLLCSLIILAQMKGFYRISKLHAENVSCIIQIREEFDKQSIT